MTTATERRAENVEAIAAVTPMQQGMLFHSLGVSDRDPYFIQQVFVIEGSLNAIALQQAWQAVSDRHQVLRADYRWEEAATPVQVIYKSRPVAIAREDWRTCPPAEQLARLRRELAEERARGFDFRRASELRLRLIELDPQTHWLTFSYHHIALDGWSLALVLGEVLSAYHTLLERGPAVLEPVAPARFSAYLDFIHKQDCALAADYWKRLLDGADVPTSLPRSAAGRSFGYEEQVRRLSRDDSEALRDRARKLGVTLNTLVQGAWALLIARHVNAAEVVLGATVSGRSAELKAIDRTVGLFINTLPSRIRLTPAARVRDWLASIQTQSLESGRFEHTPLGEIRRAAGVPGDQNLFDSVVVFENYPLDEVLERHPSELRVQPMAVEQLFEQGVRTTGRNNYPLTLNVIPGEQLVLTLAYRCDAFDEAAIAALSAQLEHLLLALSERGEGHLGEIGLPVESSPNPIEPGSARPTLLQAFARHVASAPEAVALQVEEQTCSYRELEARSNRVARFLLERGVCAEQRVGICCERSIEFVIGLLAIWKAGAAYVPLDPKLPAARLDELATESRVRLVLVERKSAGAVRDGAAIDAIVHKPYFAGPVPTALHPDQAAYVIFTSGSTGRPKGVVVSHGALANYTHGLLERLNISNGTSFAMVSTVGADLGHSVLFGALASGGRLQLLGEQRAFDPDAFADAMARHAVEVLKIVPSHLAALLHAADPARALPSRTLILGGEASEWSFVERLRQLRPECRIVNHYGPTEATVGAALYALEEGRVGRTVPIGHPLASSTLELLDRDLNRVPVGVAAELYIGGDRLARGYFGAPSATAQRFVPDPFGPPGARLYRTGDRVKRLPDGALEFLGRLDRQIKLRGYRIELGEIEGRLREHGAVRAAVVVPRAAPNGALQLLAYVVADGIGEAALQSYLRESLPESMIPARIALLPQLPLTRNGKLDLRALPAPDEAPAALNPAAPANEIEQKLIAIWREVLRIERVGVSDDFFKLGGDSILSLQIVARARRRGLKVTPQQLFECKSVRELARVAKELPPKAAPPPAASPAPARTQEGPSAEIPLLPIQARFFAREIPEPERYNQSLMLKSRERLRADALHEALHTLVAHHDALRLRFRRGASGRWEQRFAEPSGERPQLLWERTTPSAQTLESLADEAQASLDLANGPLLRALLIDGPAEEQRLLLVVHHLAVDGVSWRVLLEDLQTTYRQRLTSSAAATLPPKTTSFQRWSEELGAYAQTHALAQQLPFWLEQCGDRPAGGLPRDHAHGKNLVKFQDFIQLRLGRHDTEQLLRRAPEHYAAQLQELLLTALARALCRLGQTASLLVELESHGREDLFDAVDLSRSVGWFTSLYPVRLTPVQGGSDTLRDAVRAVSGQLRSIPQRGLGFGLLRHLAAEATQAQLRGLPTPEVTFNYLGQFDQSFADDALFDPARESSGRAQSERAPRANWLTITGQIYAGELELSFGFSRDVFEPETVQTLVQSYRAELEGLLAALESRRL